MPDAIVHSILIEEHNGIPQSGSAELQSITRVNIYPTGDESLDPDDMAAMVEQEALNNGIHSYILKDHRQTLNWGVESFGQEIILAIAAGLSGGTPPALAAYLIHKSRQAKEALNQGETGQESLVGLAIYHAARFGINEEDALVKEMDFTEDQFVVVESKRNGRTIRVDFEAGQDVVKAKRID